MIKNKYKKITSLIMLGLMAVGLTINPINSNAVDKNYENITQNFTKNYTVANDEFNKVISTDDGFVAVGEVDYDFYAEKSDGIIIKYNKSGEIQWMDIFEGNNMDSYNSVSQTPDNGYIVVGDTYSNDIGTNATSYNDNGIIIKYDSNGNRLWTKFLEGNSFDTFESIVCIDDGFVVVGYSYSNDLNDTINNGYSDGIVAKYDYEGNQQWIRTFGGDDEDCFNAVAKINDGGFIVAGEIYSKNIEGLDSVSNNECVIVKYDKYGNEQWSMLFGGNGHEFLLDVISTKDNGFVIVGNTDSNNISGIECKGDDDAFIAKYDENGVMQWVSNFGGDGYDAFSSVQETSDKGFLAIGYSYSSFINGIVNETTPNGIIVKYDKNGNEEWFETFSEKKNKLNSITQINTNEFIVAGCIADGGTKALITSFSLNKKTLGTSDELQLTVEADNSLELALSTNQITFSGYNGTQDFTNNDLNVTVSSGLNYDLSATMLSEFTPTFDSNATLDSSNLQIKTALDSNYTPFTTIGDKVILVANAPNGKDNVHNINFKLIGDSSVKADTYNTSIKFEATQK